jgi:tetratricopeptide (TPR) repeat protein
MLLALVADGLVAQGDSQWPEVQQELGIIEFRLALRDPIRWPMEPAIEKHRAALREFERSHNHSGIASSCANLGAALSALGLYQRKADTIEEAIGILLRAVDEYQKLGSIEMWQAQNNVGNAKWRLAELLKSDTILEQAITIFREIGGSAARERAPSAWVIAQVNLASTLTELALSPRPRGHLGARESREMLLEGSAEASRQALTVVTPQNNPAQWSRAHMELGRALALSHRGDDGAKLEEAVESFRKAATVITPVGDREGWLYLQRERARALLWLGRRKLDSKLISEAIGILREMAVVSPDASARAEFKQVSAYAEDLRRWIDCRCGDKPALAALEPASGN